MLNRNQSTGFHFKTFDRDPVSSGNLIPNHRHIWRARGMLKLVLLARDEEVQLAR